MDTQLASREAEQAVLGGVFLDRRAYSKIQGVVVPSDFHFPDHSLILSAISEVEATGNASDMVTVAEWLESNQKLEEAGGLSYLAQLAESTPSSVNISAYAGIVKSKSKLRQLQEICENTLLTLQNPDGKTTDEVITETQTELDQIISVGGSDATNWLQVLERADQSIMDALHRRETGLSIGIPTGLPSLDSRVGGWLRKRLNIVAGRPGLGKTAFTQQAILHAAKHNHPVGICSLEMSIEELGVRSYANELDLNGTALSFGVKKEIQQYTEKLSTKSFSSLPIWIDESTTSLSGIIARAHEWKHKHDIEILVVDHIGLVEADAKSANERLGLITRQLKKISKKLDIAVIGVCQLNRAMEKEKRRPALSDLRDSGSIEQDCDVAIFIHSSDELDSDGHVIAVELGALKCRFGKKGWLPQHFEFNGRTQKFIEIDEVHQWSR